MVAAYGKLKGPMWDKYGLGPTSTTVRATFPVEEVVYTNESRPGAILVIYISK